VKPKIEFWFDFSCPFAYLGSVGIEAFATRLGADLELKPMLLGGVFRARKVPQNLAASVSEAKARHNLNDMTRYARAWDVPFEMPNGHPLRTVNALRAVLAAGAPFEKLMHDFYRAYWVEGLDISDGEQIRNVLQRSGFDVESIMAAIKTERIKQSLFDRTDEAISKGIFGAPGIIVDGTLYWGQDRLNLIEHSLTGHFPEPELSAPILHEVDFYFDYASPFTFLAAQRVHALFGSKLRYRPMSLTRVWKENNPGALERNPHNPKREYLGADFRRQAIAHGLDHQWPSVFPVETDLALKVTLLANNRPDLISKIFDAYWRKGRDISQAAVLSDVCTQSGLNGNQLVAQAVKGDAKNDLREATQLAIEAGVFGAPTTVVQLPNAPVALYFGNDRLWMAALAARGDTKVV